MSQVNLARIIPKLSFADQLNEACSLLPVVARRYSKTYCALRHFVVPAFTDAKNYKTTRQGNDSQRVIFYLDAAKGDEKFFTTRLLITNQQRTTGTGRREPSKGRCH